MWRSHSSGTGFENMQESQRKAEAWHCIEEIKSLYKKAQRGQWAREVSVAKEVPEFLESWREVEVSHHMKGLESLQRAQDMELMKVQPICSRNPIILEMLVPWDDCQGQQQLWSGNHPGAGRQALCTMKSRAEKNYGSNPKKL